MEEEMKSIKTTKRRMRLVSRGAEKGVERNEGEEGQEETGLGRGEKVGE
jgi:hypothetical protein